MSGLLLKASKHRQTLKAELGKNKYFYLLPLVLQFLMGTIYPHTIVGSKLEQAHFFPTSMYHMKLFMHIMKPQI